jgi:hypothetical protein
MMETDTIALGEERMRMVKEKMTGIIRRLNQQQMQGQNAGKRYVHI